MGLRVYQISPYDHKAEQQQFDKVNHVLKERFDEDGADAILIGNYNIEGVELDALLITNYSIQILEFKNWGGTILARENGTWKSGERDINGGASDKNPFKQMRINRSRTFIGLKKFLKRNDLAQILGVIIFSQDATINDEGISETTKKWLKICDNKGLKNALLDTQTKIVFQRDEMLSMPDKLLISEFLKYDHPSDGTKELLPLPAYREETALSFYSSLFEATNSQYIRSTYKTFDTILRLAVDQKTSFTTINLNGLFSKINYLASEYKVSDSIFKAVNDTRARLRNINDWTDIKLKEVLTADLKAICEFIESVYGEPVPTEIKSLFPIIAAIPEKPKNKAIADCYRVLVRDWDEANIYGKCEEIGIEDMQICYSGSKNIQEDWTYIREYLLKDSQINIVRPIIVDDIYYPEQIIFEPDYLVDVSTIANCFEEYAHRPILNLIQKITPSENSSAIMLGNFAGQLLDEEIHSTPEENSYDESYNQYLRSNSFNALTTDIDNLRRDGEAQKRNIHIALSNGLREQVGSYRSDDVMLEPSFFCEMLGIQGRMDFLQLDHRVLLEQKSGKGAFVRGAQPNDPPQQQEKHYVQMLLYRAILHYNFHKDNRDIQSFLLYSKYQNGLIGLGPAPVLLHEAIKIRNGLAWCENMFCHNGVQILDDLTPNSLRSRQISDRFWDDWILPKLNSVFDPIKNASELERAYFYRFMTFLENEHMLAKVGDRSKNNNGFASKWHDSLEEKKQTGNIYDSLFLNIPVQEEGGAIKTIEMIFSEGMSADTSNFRKGDIVIVYPYNEAEEPDARKTMVFRCTIKDICIDRLVLQLRSPQSDKKVFLRETGKVWAVEHDFFESSFSSLYRGMFSLLTATKERKDLLLLQREPSTDNSKRLIGDYGDFNELSTRVKQANDLFLIIGPPGTGKTSYGMLNTVKEELSELSRINSRDSVLIMSYTNRAVDEICSKLDEEGIDFIRLGNILSCDEPYRKYLLDSKLIDIEDVDEMRRVVEGARVIVGTTTALNGHIAIFKIKKFSLAIIDEASQILEPHLIGILCAKHDNESAIKKIVMIGDHKQLPAVVQQSASTSKVLDPDLHDIYLTDCRLSLFERLLKKYRRNKGVTYMLTKQGRMHHDIAIFPNYCFYQGKLQEVPRTHQIVELGRHSANDNGIENLLSTRRVAFIAVDAPENSPSDKVNEAEAGMIAATVVKIYEREREKFDVNKSVGVIVPYRNQIATIRNIIDKYNYPILHDITIDTVERYQGSQRDYILYGFTVQKLYQLNFLTSNVFVEDGAIIDRKLNVAMTRAREHLIMFGNPALLAEDITFYKLIEFARSKHGYFNVKPEKYVIGKFDVPDYEKVELDLSGASYSISDAFKRAFNSIVLEPVKAESPNWPEEVFGADMNTNLNLIQYGRINFSNELPLFENEEKLTPQKQVLLYCYYIMRQHYCSEANLCNSFGEWISSRILATGGRIQMIDIGCGPGTCGLAFYEAFKDISRDYLYVGVDVSAEMKRIAGMMLDNVFGQSVRYRFADSFAELGSTYWNAISENPSTIVINLSYFFSNINPKFAEELAKKIIEKVKEYPLNKYVIMVQHSELDAKCNSYKVFKGIISECFQSYKSDFSDFSYTLGCKERTLQFSYDIMENA